MRTPYDPFDFFVNFFLILMYSYIGMKIIGFIIKEGIEIYDEIRLLLKRKNLLYSVGEKE